MHAVERIDLVIPPGGHVPKSRAAEKLQAIRDVLSELCEFQRTSAPASYEEAFAICTADWRRAKAERDAPPEATTSEPATTVANSQAEP